MIGEASIRPLCVVLAGLLSVIPAGAQQARSPASTAPQKPADVRIEVKGVTIEGAKQVGAGRVQKVLQTRKSARLPWGANRYLDKAALQADLKRIEAFYAARGFPDATVSKLDLQFNDAQDQVRILIVISEGEPVIVESITFQGFEVIPQDHFDELQKRALIKEGQPRDVASIRATRDMGATELRDHGFPYALVHAQEDSGSTPRRVRLAFAAQPKAKAVFGPIEIAGNKSVGENVIRRQLTYHPGDLFRESQLLASQRKLYSVELFQFANIENPVKEQEPVEVPTRVTVAEGKHQRVRFRIGYGTEEKGRAEVEYRHVNFLGGGRTGTVRGKWSSLERGARVEFNEPYFFRNNLSFGANGQNWFISEPLYEEETVGGRATVSYRKLQGGALPRDQHSTTLSFSYINEYKNSVIADEALNDPSLRDELIALGFDPTTGTEQGTLSALAFDIQRNTTDSLLDARRGYIASGHLEQAGRFLPGSYNYFEVSSEGRYYLAISDFAVFAQRLRFGAIDASGTDQVPFFKRYFLGGSTSLRGWGRYEVGPLSGSGLTIGGHTMLESTTELRMPLWGKLGGVIFLDAGNVWPNSWDINLNDLRYSVGPGLRYTTPIGPVRFDVGYQLTPIEGLLVNGVPEKRRFRLHFSIGQAF